MADNPHLADGPYFGGVPLDEATRVAVLLHGRGAGPESILALERPIGLDGVHYLAPSAARGTWYPQRFIAPIEANEPWLSYALDAIATVLDRLEGRGWPPERVALVGFSQGACLTLEYLARHPRRYGGVAGLTGGLIGPDDGALTRPPEGSLAATPVLVTSKERDPHVPAGRAELSASILFAAGAEVDLRILPPGPHAATIEEVDAVRALIEGAGQG